MKRFEFSLQKLLETREALEQAAEEKLARGMRELQAALEKVRQLQERRNREIERIEAMKGTQTARHHYSMQLRFIDRVDQHIALHARKAAELQARVDELRVALHEIMRDRKSVEKLKEREHLQWQKEQKDWEQKEMDEFAAASHLLQKMGNAPDETGAGAHRRGYQT